MLYIIMKKKVILNTVLTTILEFRIPHHIIERMIAQAVPTAVQR